MSNSSRATPVSTAVAIVIIAALSGCSSPAVTPAAGSSSGSSTGSASSATPAQASGPAFKACEAVPSAMIFATLKVTVPDGTADSPDVCKYKAAGVTIVVQTSTEASVFYPKSTYGAAAVPGTIDLTGGDVSYGYYAPTDGSGQLGNVTVLVVKGEKAVFFTGNLTTPGITQDVLNLATAISIAF